MYTKGYLRQRNPAFFSEIPWREKRRTFEDTKTPQQEFKRIDSIVNVSLGDKVIQHSFTRISERDPMPDHFIQEVKDLMEDLTQESAFVGRTFLQLPI